MKAGFFGIVIGLVLVLLPLSIQAKEDSIVDDLSVDEVQRLLFGTEPAYPIGAEPIYPTPKINAITKRGWSGRSGSVLYDQMKNSARQPLSIQAEEDLSVDGMQYLLSKTEAIYPTQKINTIQY